MKRALILIGLAAATAGCQQASASTDSPAAPDPRLEARTPDRFMARSPENRERIRRGQVSCVKKIASVPC